jgi:L-ribulose-5-phosphate 3-epimerase
MTRREFAWGAASALQAAPQAPRFRKSISSVIFPNAMPVEEYFAAARDAGFQGVEIPLGKTLAMDTPPDRLKRIADAAAKARCAIVSLWISAPLSANPLNSPDPAKRAKGAEVVKRGVDICAGLGCEAMLLVPGRLGSGGHLDAGYEDTWNRVTEALRPVVPYAAAHKVSITPENVWNKFLVSPLDMRRFVDQFHSPHLAVHFDVGNIMQYGFPQDWILTLGARIRRVHLKDYKLSSRAEQGRFVPLLEGDVAWKEVMAAFVKTGYSGFMSPEYGYDENDPGQIRRISAAVDKIFALA